MCGVSDQNLISNFYPVMTEDFPVPAAPGTAVELHAELLHRICLADGLLEVLEWTRQGSAADPLACMWLAGLRWYRLLTGAYPSGAPQPPPRETDAALADLLQAGLLRVSPPGGEVSRESLSSGKLHYPGSPAAPGAADPDVLLRLAPLALVPYVDWQMRLRWVGQNLAMTHGHPELLEQARELVTGLHDRASTSASAPKREAAGSVGAKRQASSAPTAHPLFALTASLAQRWEDVTAAP